MRLKYFCLIFDFSFIDAPLCVLIYKLCADYVRRDGDEVEDEYILWSAEIFKRTIQSVFYLEMISESSKSVQQINFIKERKQTVTAFNLSNKI